MLRVGLYTPAFRMFALGCYCAKAPGSWTAGIANTGVAAIIDGMAVAPRIVSLVNGFSPRIDQ